MLFCRFAETATVLFFPGTLTIAGKHGSSSILRIIIEREQRQRQSGLSAPFVREILTGEQRFPDGTPERQGERQCKNMAMQEHRCRKASGSG
jgi:hypothetical protein